MTVVPNYISSEMVHQIPQIGSDNSYQLHQDPTYKRRRSFALTAIHAKKEQRDKFYELVKWRLKGQYGLSIIEGDNDALFLLFPTVPSLHAIKDTTDCLALCWQLVTLFD